MAAITVVDETTSGQRGDAWGLEVSEETLPLRELIRRRVFREVCEDHARRPQRSSAALRADDAGRALDGGRPRASYWAGLQEQFERAVEAFSRNGFFVIVDDRQVSDLDAQVDLRPGSEVVFLKLVPLAGG